MSEKGAPLSVDVRDLPAAERKKRVAEYVGNAIDQGLSVAVVVYLPDAPGVDEMVRALCAMAGNPFIPAPD